MRVTVNIDSNLQRIFGAETASFWLTKSCNPVTSLMLPVVTIYLPARVSKLFRGGPSKSPPCETLLSTSYVVGMLMGADGPFTRHMVIQAHISASPDRNWPHPISVRQAASLACVAKSNQSAGERRSLLNYRHSFVEAHAVEHCSGTVADVYSMMGSETPGKHRCRCHIPSLDRGMTYRSRHVAKLDPLAICRDQIVIKVEEIAHGIATLHKAHRSGSELNSSHMSL
jgi:hypothetical protein